VSVSINHTILQLSFGKTELLLVTYRKFGNKAEPPNVSFSFVASIVLQHQNSFRFLLPAKCHSSKGNAFSLINIRFLQNLGWVIIIMLSRNRISHHQLLIHHLLHMKSYFSLTMATAFIKSQNVD
jgi:hypothetical protein